MAAMDQLSKLPPISSKTGVELSIRDVKTYEGLTGPSYSLSHKKPGARYNLPPTTILRPYQDTNSGNLETWPAHATGQQSMTTVLLNKDKQLVVVDEEAAGRTNIVPKPKFLDQLETYLKKEIRALGVTNVEANDLRLQAHREVFEYLIEDFKTYRPLLSSIKNEYEMMLAQQRKKIRELEPLNQMLVTVTEQCEQTIMGVKEQEKQEMIDLKKENHRLYQRIDELKLKEAALQTQVEKLQEELAAEYLRYRDECDARKLLVVDINELRYQQEDMLLSKQNMSELEEEQEDPVTLKIALRRAREDETNMSKRLNDMIANYGDVIPRRDYEALKTVHQEVEGKVSVIMNDLTTLKAEHDVLLETHKALTEERDSYYKEAEVLKRSATPRPEWQNCAEFVAGGAARWQELSANKSSSDLMQVLLNEISGAGNADASGAEYFDPMGTGEEVPQFLRCETKVRNRRLGKRDTSLLIQDIWREKATHDAERTEGGNPRDSLSTFLHLYMTRRFALDTLVSEWAYNLNDSAQRYSHDEMIGTFGAILNNDMDEEVYHLQHEAITRLFNNLTKIDVDKGNLSSLSKEDFRAALKEFFPSDTDASIDVLIKAAETQLGVADAEVEAKSLEYKGLFTEDDEGRTGTFLVELKKHMRASQLSYADDIIKSLGDVTEVKVEDLKKGILSVDPDIEGPDVEKYLKWTFNQPDAEGLDKVAPLALEGVTKRFRKGGLKRVTVSKPKEETPQPPSTEATSVPAPADA